MSVPWPRLLLGRLQRFGDYEYFDVPEDDADEYDHTETYVPLADAKEAESVAVRRYEEVRALDEKLRTLRSGLEAEVARLREIAAISSTGKPHLNVGAHRLQQLLDASEDTD